MNYMFLLGEDGNSANPVIQITTELGERKAIAEMELSLIH